MFNVAHLSNFVVNFNSVLLYKPKCIVISTDPFSFFRSKWPEVLRTFTRLFFFFFRKWFWQELIFGMTTMDFGLGKPSPGQKRINSHSKNKEFLS